MAGASGVTPASFPTQAVQATVSTQRLAVAETRLLADANFDARMAAIEGKISTIQVELDKMAHTVTESVLLGLQREGGLLWQQDQKIDSLQTKLLEFLPKVQAALNLQERNSGHPAPDSPSHKNRKLDSTSPMTAVRTD
jgi:hypothetical protein